MSTSTYATPRKCECCPFETVIRDAYWAHVIAHRAHENRECGCPAAPCPVSPYVGEAS